MVLISSFKELELGSVGKRASFWTKFPSLNFLGPLVCPTYVIPRDYTDWVTWSPLRLRSCARATVALLGLYYWNQIIDYYKLTYGIGNT